MVTEILNWTVRYAAVGLLVLTLMRWVLGPMPKMEKPWLTVSLCLAFWPALLVKLAVELVKLWYRWLIGRA